MAFVPQSTGQGYPPIGSVIVADAYDDKTPLGTIITAVDPTLGAGEFIYLKGVGSTVAGSIVNYDDNFQTALDTTAAAGPSRPLAVAMAATVADRKGWYQIAGNAVAVKSSAVGFTDGAGLGAAAGFAVAVSTGSVIQGAVVRAAATASTGVTSVAIAINRPHDPSDVS